MSRDRAFHRSVLIFFVLWCGSCGAQTDDNFPRAAYCFGVLYATFWEHPQSEDRLAAKCQQADPHVWTFNDCRSAIAKYAGDQTWRERYSNYERYWAFFRFVPAEQVQSLGAVIEKGKRDGYKYKMAAESARVFKCFEGGCLLASAQRPSCIVECVAQDDQVHADVLRCQLMPDAIPVFPPAE